MFTAVRHFHNFKVFLQLKKLVYFFQTIKRTVSSFRLIEGFSVLVPDMIHV